MKKVFAALGLSLALIGVGHSHSELIINPEQLISAHADNPADAVQQPASAEMSDGEMDSWLLFEQLGLNGSLDFVVFKQAVDNYNSVKGKKKSYLTIIDYTKPSTDKRFFVIDMAQQQVVFNTYVSHGQNSGLKYATKFSNTVDSRQTSLGVFLTAETYQGGNGYSLRLEGLSPGMNDKARQRYIVIHGADYATERFIERRGYLGRSWGCPALPSNQAVEVIDTIKHGSVIYAYGQAS